MFIFLNSAHLYFIDFCKQRRSTTYYLLLVFKALTLIWTMSNKPYAHILPNYLWFSKVVVCVFGKSQHAHLSHYFSGSYLIFIPRLCLGGLDGSKSLWWLCWVVYTLLSLNSKSNDSNLYLNNLGLTLNHVALGSFPDWSRKIKVS